jgi:hypothetical protein
VTLELGPLPEIVMAHRHKPEESSGESLRVSLTSDEFVALKEYAAKRRKGFRKDFPLWVSISAVLLSFVTSVISIREGNRRDVHDQLTELSAAIQTLQDLNQKQIETREKYASSSNNSNEASASALIGNSMYIATMRAAQIVFSVQNDATTAAIIPISQSVYHYGQYTKAEALAQIGLDAAQTAEDEASALRWLGAIRIRERTAQSVKEGNQLFLRALDFEKKYGPMRDPAVTAFIRAGLQLDWADALAVVDCNEARKHFTENWIILSSAGQTEDLDRLRRLARSKLATGIGGIRSCNPAADSPISN